MALKEKATIVGLFATLTLIRWSVLADRRLIVVAKGGLIAAPIRKTRRKACNDFKYSTRILSTIDDFSAFKTVNKKNQREEVAR